MTDKQPLDKTTDELSDIVEKLQSPNSPVGIDAVYTHAVIIDYLRRISARLDELEQRIADAC